MYLTFFDKLIEIVIDVGSKGFNFCLYIVEFPLFSIDTYYKDFAITLIAIVIFWRKIYGNRN